MASQVSKLSEVLKQTMVQDKGLRKNAENELKVLESQEGYGLTVLQVVATQEISMEARVAAAIAFKNHIKYHWAPDDKSDHRPVSSTEKEQVKTHIVEIMLKSPSLVRAQISESMTIISQHDFPHAWPNLLPQLTQKLVEKDIGILNGVLTTANSVLKRFRNQYMSDRISNELENAQAAFVKPMLGALDTLWQAADANSSNREVLKSVFESFRLSCRVFYSLNALGLTEHMEDNLKAWMTCFLKLVEYENPILAEQDSEQESCLDGVKAAVCESITLFVQLNEEDFEEFLQPFVMAIWAQLVKVSPNPGQDHMTITAIQFLTGVAKTAHSTLFAQENTLQQICEKVVVPNLKLRKFDEELFEDNPVEYIQRDTEGSDTGTRRRAAADFVKALAEVFTKEVTNLFTGYVGMLLNEHKGNPGANWRAKDCAIYLVVALTVKGRTLAQGATTINQCVPLMPFFSEHINPELQARDGINSTPIIKADALKFIATFRTLIPKEAQLALFPNLVALLGSEHFVVHSYAAITIERLLALKENQVQRFTPQDLAPFLQQLLERLFGAFSLPESSENQYVMQCIMRVIKFVGNNISPVAGVCLQALAQKLLEVCKNPMQPVFSHYLFEAVAALIKYTCVNDQQMLNRVQDTLFPAFDVVLQQDVQEFHPYVFQIFAQLIEMRPQPLPDVYRQLFPPMLNHVIWERQGNVPALTRLIKAYLKKSAAEIFRGRHLDGVLGVFQRLLQSKALDQYAFEILEEVYANFDAQTLEQYQNPIWTLLCQRLQTKRTSKYVKGLLAFMGNCICRRGALSIADELNKIQQGVFMMLIEQVWLESLAIVEGKNKQKVCAVGLTKVLCEYPPLLEEGREALWTRLMDALVRYLEGKGDVELAEDAEDVIIETTGYTAQYSELVNSVNPEQDPLPEVQNPRDFLAKSLFKLMSSQPGRLAAIQNLLHPETKEKLKQFCVVAKVTAVF